MTTPDPIQQAINAMEDALAHSVDASTYPDGPCLDEWVRDDLRSALAALRKARERATYFTGTNEDPPALLIPLEPSTEGEV